MTRWLFTAAFVIGVAAAAPADEPKRVNPFTSKPLTEQKQKQKDEKKPAEAKPEGKVARVAHIKLAGDMDESPVPADSLFGTPPENLRIKLDRIKTLFQNPTAHFASVYGWGTPAFDPIEILRAMLMFYSEESSVAVGKVGADAFLEVGPFRWSRDSTQVPPGLLLDASTTFSRRPSTSRSASRMIRPSALSVTNALVAPRCSHGRAAGACSPNACTCAITSWRRRFSCSAARCRSAVSRLARISAIAWSGMARPSSRSASASASHTRRQRPMR